MRTLTPAERLIVAADFKPIEPNGRESVRKQVLSLADDLNGIGVYLKVNSALRALGYGLIEEIHERGLRVFADIKLFDIKETLITDGALLREVKPELLTTACGAGVVALQALKAELPDTEVLGVTVLTSLTDEDTRALFTCSTEEAVMRLAQIGADAKIDGLISSAKEAAVLRAKFGVLLSLNTPSVRPAGVVVPGDDQNPSRVMTPERAIAAGADRIVVGRPITQQLNGASRREAALRTIEEIASVAA
jgi:orotidine-5'-phosphate decarboxylase